MTNEAISRIVGTKGADNEEHVVVFDLAAESYALDIQSVQEIVLVQKITSVPGTDPWVKGMINLAGRVIPIIDLRQRCNVTASEHTSETRIVVVLSARGLVGLIVDAVSEVLRIPRDEIVPPSVVASAEGNSYLRGVAKLNDRLVSLMDLDGLISAESVANVAKAAA